MFNAKKNIPKEVRILQLSLTMLTLISTNAMAFDPIGIGGGGKGGGSQLSCSVWTCPIYCTEPVDGTGYLQNPIDSIFAQRARPGNNLGSSSCANRSLLSRLVESCAEGQIWTNILKNIIERCSKNAHHILRNQSYDIARFFPRLASKAQSFDELAKLICEGVMKNIKRINDILDEITQVVIREAQDLAGILRSLKQDIDNLRTAIAAIKQQMILPGADIITLRAQLLAKTNELTRKVEAYDSGRGKLDLLKDIWEQSVGQIEKGLCEPRVTGGGTALQSIIDSFPKL